MSTVSHIVHQESTSVHLSKESLQALNTDVRTSIQAPQSEDTMSMVDDVLLPTPLSSSSSSEIDPEEQAERAASVNSSTHPTNDISLPSPPPAASSIILKRLSSEFSFAEGEKIQETNETETPKPISRPLSRQELRRKSSFFNNKEIVINPQRFSASTNTSLRPIADPRFKNRFQSILSQWKARDSS
ncbi:hypothetical protein BG004_003049 [Podila humilis]|nr:hypothetical protein BG004_003049 [Podila humilis]